MRLFRPNVKRMLKKRDVKGLIGAMNDEERAIRLTAIEALGEIGDPRAVEPLIAALQDGSWGVRSYAAAALGAIGDARAVKPLTALIRDSKKVVRKAAAEALSKIGPSSDPESLAWYLVALEQWDRVVSLGEAAVEPLIAALGMVRLAPPGSWERSGLPGRQSRWYLSSKTGIIICARLPPGRWSRSACRPTP